MKTLLILLTAVAAMSCLTTGSQAKEYAVQNIGKGGLKASCGRGGGTFSDGENSYSCTYQNGNIRECSKRDGHCIVVTPPKSVKHIPDGPVFDGLGDMAVGQFD